MKSGIAGSREGSGGGDSVDSGYEEYEEDYRLFICNLDPEISAWTSFILVHIVMLATCSVIEQTADIAFQSKMLMNHSFAAIS